MTRELLPHLLIPFGSSNLYQQILVQQIAR